MLQKLVLSAEQIVGGYSFFYCHLAFFAHLMESKWKILGQQILHAYSDEPLVIDPVNQLYTCYDEADQIQVYPFPKPAIKAIKPPKGCQAREGRFFLTVS